VTTEREFAARFRDGDDATLRDVYERYSGAVFTVAYSILRDRTRAADAAQATFVNAWRAAPRFDIDQPLGPWLYTIARRAAIDSYRRERRLESTDPDVLDGRSGSDGPSMERTWEAWQVRMAVDALPEDERQVVRLAWYEGFSHPEIADRLHVPVGTVKSRSHRAHRRLAEALAHVRVENRSDGSGVADGAAVAGGACDSEFDNEQ